jgi:hypothetical protein
MTWEESAAIVSITSSDSDMMYSRNEICEQAPGPQESGVSGHVFSLGCWKPIHGLFLRFQLARIEDSILYGRDVLVG